MYAASFSPPWALRSAQVQNYFKRRIQAGPPGPSDEERARDGDAPAGYQTPSLAYGADFVLEVPGVERVDE